MFILSTNKVGAEDALIVVPLEKKIVKDVYRLSSNTYITSTTGTQIESRT